MDTRPLFWGRSYITYLIIFRIFKCLQCFTCHMPAACFWDQSGQTCTWLKKYCRGTWSGSVTRSCALTKRPASTLRTLKKRLDLFNYFSTKLIKAPPKTLNISFCMSTGSLLGRLPWWDSHILHINHEYLIRYAFCPPQTGTSASRTPASMEETAPTRGGHSTAPAWPPTTEKPVSWEPENSYQLHHGPADQVSRCVGSTQKWAWPTIIARKSGSLWVFDDCDISFSAPPQNIFSVPLTVRQRVSRCAPPSTALRGALVCQDSNYRATSGAASPKVWFSNIRIFTHPHRLAKRPAALPLVEFPCGSLSETSNRSASLCLHGNCPWQVRP